MLFDGWQSVGLQYLLSFLAFRIRQDMQDNRPAVDFSAAGPTQHPQYFCKWGSNVVIAEANDALDTTHTILAQSAGPPR